MRRMLLVTMTFLGAGIGSSAVATGGSNLEERDCSEASGDQTARCVVVPCSEKFESFLGVWEGPFAGYDRTLQRLRPYHNQVVYSRQDCLQDVVTRDTFIIGRRTDHYSAVIDAQTGTVLAPEKTEIGRLITGLLAGDRSRPFLRSVDEVNGRSDYELVYRNGAAELAVWKFDYPGDSKNPPMTFTAIDGRDMTVTHEHKRLVTVTLAIPGQEEMVVTKGYHTQAAVP